MSVLEMKDISYSYEKSRKILTAVNAVFETGNANWLIMNGNRVQIKRKQFEKMIDSMEVI